MSLLKYINEALKINSKSKVVRKHLKVKNSDELCYVIKEKINKIDNDGYLDLTDIDLFDSDKLICKFLFDKINVDTKSKIKKIDVTGWDVSHIEDFEFMFRLLPNTEEIIGLDTWDMSNAISIKGMFRNCKKLKDISGIYNWNISKITNMDHLFGSCLSLKEIDLSKWKTDNVNELSFMFDCCRNLTKIDVSNISLSKTNSKASIFVEKVFNQCENLSDLKMFDFNNVEIYDASFMFFNCLKLKEIDLINFNIKKIRSMEGLFCYCESLEKINCIGTKPIESWNVGNKLIQLIFNNCKKLDLTLNWKSRKYQRVHLCGSNSAVKLPYIT